MVGTQHHYFGSASHRAFQPTQLFGRDPSASLPAFVAIHLSSGHILPVTVHINRALKMGAAGNLGVDWQYPSLFETPRAPLTPASDVDADTRPGKKSSLRCTSGAKAFLLFPCGKHFEVGIV